MTLVKITLSFYKMKCFLNLASKHLLVPKHLWIEKSYQLPLHEMRDLNLLDFRIKILFTTYAIIRFNDKSAELLNFSWRTANSGSLPHKHRARSPSLTPTHSLSG